MKSNNLLYKEKEKGKLEKINSKYILKIVLDNLREKTLLDIIKYNKNIKKRIDININHYKKYSQNYSSIEIEIKLVNNKYDDFINIKKEEEEYYHIYNNYHLEEIKRNYIKQNEEINTDYYKIIKIIIDYHITSLEKII